MKKKIDTIFIRFFAAAFIISAALFFYQCFLYTRAQNTYKDLHKIYVKSISEEGKNGNNPEEKGGSGSAMGKDDEKNGNTGTGGIGETDGNVPIAVDFEEIRRINPHVVGWIYCPDTVISYPIMQDKDNSFYLNHMYNGQKNKAGAIFLDCHDSPEMTDFHSIIYGHNMKDGSMFGIVDKYGNQSFYDQHPVWYLLTPEKNYRLELFSGYVVTEDSDAYNMEFESEEEKQAFLNAIVKRSYFKSQFKPEGGPVVTLSTCVYDFENARFVLHGQLIEIP